MKLELKHNNQVSSNSETSKPEVLISVKNLQKSFDGLEIIKDVSFELGAGENLVIMGKSGTGKSVLIKCIIGLLRPDGGELHVLGYDMMKIHEDELNEVRRSLGYLFQGGALYDSMTVERNLKFPLRRLSQAPSEAEIEDLVDEMLNNVGLIKTKDKYPSQLSGGMKKRIALARTIIMKPKVMLYDEPTTGLDVITSNEISDLILELRNKYKMSSIIITHDVSCIDKTADRIIILEDGKIFNEGTYKEIRNTNDRETRLYFEAVK